MNDRIVNFHTDEALYLIAFQLNSEQDDPELYTLLIYGDNDRPILVDGLILFFNRPELASDALQVSATDLKNIYSVPQTVELIVDVSTTLYLLQSEDIDTTSTILNCINMFDDFLKAIGFSMPSQYKSILYSLADHLTFDREFSKA